MRFAIFEPLVGTRVSADVAQAWSLLEAISLYDPGVPEKRVWLTRRLVRHHRSQQAIDGDLDELPLAFVESNRSLQPAAQMVEIRRQMWPLA